MTLQRKLGIRYAAIVLGCLALLAGLAHHEFVTEPHLRKVLGIAELPETAVGEWIEVFFYGMIPVILTGGWWLMRRSLQPINDLAQGVERIQADNLRERLPRTGSGDEVDRLTEVFNAMTARIDASFQQIRQFTLHASHELKTPLTVLSAQLESALREPPTNREAQAEWVHSVLDEVQRLTKIVESLTLLTKADSGLLTLDRKELRLDELVRESHEDASILAEAKGLKVVLGDCDEVTIRGDRHRLRQLLLNLADNAVKYSLPGGTVALSVVRANGQARIRFSNSSAAISPELQSQAFERFVRGSTARVAAADGCGLGLAIAKWIVEAHEGTIALNFEPPDQAVVTVLLPLAVQPAVS